MTVDEAINQMMTCAPGTGCRHEAACFLVAGTLRKLRNRQAVSNQPDASFMVNRPEPLPDLDIPHYAPTWESPRRLMQNDFLDWSAA